MSMKDLQEAQHLIAERPDLPDFVGGASEDLIGEAEQALGVSFPPTYRNYLRTLGAGSFGAEEFYGILGADLGAPYVPNAVWLTLTNRHDFGLPVHLIDIYSLGEGTDFFLDVSKTEAGGECPVVTWHPGCTRPQDRVQIEASDFGKFFLDLVKEVLERH
jgi:hypothetical protein